ncbi:hypothetical protein AX17_005423 [Amanita inopinata Kibby_2008]|nr:hypothetical protein AX17_005423 [Amanita inopinata Kibby_2008]
MSPQCSSDDYIDARSSCQNLPHASTSPGYQSSESHPFPIGQFPSDVLTEIFKHCLPIPGDCIQVPKDVAPLLLCHVCKSWWTLARSTPELWKALAIRVLEIREDVKFVATFITAWLERSGVLPLTVHLQILDCIPKAYVDAILKCFCQYASRLESVYIGYPYASPVALPEMGELPLLRSFRYAPFVPNQNHLPFTSAPRLTQLRWPGPLSITKRPSIPWHQLTHLDITSSPYTVIEMIQNCPELLELIVQIDGDTSEDNMLPCRPRVLQKRLCTLHMYNGITGHLLDPLILPALKNLSLSNSEDFSIEIIQQQLLLLFSRSNCMLDRLTLHNCGGKAPMFLEILQHRSLSSLTELEVINWDGCQSLNDNTLLQLTDTPSGNTKLLLPKLSHLKLETCVSASPGMLGRMVFSRCCPSKREDRLKSFSFSANDIDGDDEDYIDRARQCGLAVDISQNEVCTGYESSDIDSDQYYDSPVDIDSDYYLDSD